MNQIFKKKKLEKILYRRGMLQTIDGKVINPPKRMYRNLGEEILWILNQGDIKLTTTELSNYLAKDIKTIQKVMRKLTASSVNLVKKQKQASKYVYSANFNRDLDIPTLYKLTRISATQYIR